MDNYFALKITGAFALLSITLFGQPTFAASPPSLKDLLKIANLRSEKYCQGAIEETKYDPDKATILLIDKGSFCTYLLQVDDQGMAQSVFSTPNSIGRAGHETKAGIYTVGRLVRNPVWVNPETGSTIAPYNQTHSNPLGVAALTLISQQGVEINMAVHGTNHEELVGGKHVSGGCIRHFNLAAHLIVEALYTGDTVVITDSLKSLIVPVPNFTAPNL